MRLRNENLSIISVTINAHTYTRDESATLTDEHGTHPNPNVGTFDIADDTDANALLDLAGWSLAEHAPGASDRLLGSDGGGGAVLPTWFMADHGSPVGVITPNQQGAFYQDIDNGAIYEAFGVTNVDWLLVGTADVPIVGVRRDSSGNVQLLGPDAGYVALQTVPNGYGDGDGVFVNGPDNGDTIVLFTNSAVAQRAWRFKPDGGVQLPGGNTLYNTAAAPDNAVGADGDWAIAADGNLYHKAAGAWAVADGGGGGIEPGEPQTQFTADDGGVGYHGPDNVPLIAAKQDGNAHDQLKLWDSGIIDIGDGGANPQARITYFSNELRIGTRAGVTGKTVGLQIQETDVVAIGGTGGAPELGFFNANGTVTQPGAIADASGGATVDTQARAAINALLAACRNLGLISF